jgi:hypothetical protein
MLFKKMSNIEILDLIYTGTLLKYPEIIASVSYDYYYSLIDLDFHTVSGYQLFHLWVSNRLVHDFPQEEYITTRMNAVDIMIRKNIVSAIKSYIWNVLQEYNMCRLRVLDNEHYYSVNPIGLNYRGLFLQLDKAMYLYRVISRFTLKLLDP